MGRLLTSFVLGTVFLGACADAGQPLGARDGTVKLPSTVLQELECTGTAAGISCAPATPRLGGASGVIYGGQNVFVRLSSSNAGYDAGTETYSVDVTVQNLMNEAIGTPDGVTPDPDGIRVFFSQQPYATAGAGEVTVANADGTDFFTAANQPFHRYSQILAKDVVSGSKTWQFNKPATVTTFSFKVMIETDVQYLLVINEVLVNPANFNATPDATGEWVELYNAGTREVDLQGLVIADSAASGRRPYHLISSSVVVAPGGYVVLGSTTNTTNNGGVPVDYAWGTGIVNLQNSLDAFKISRVYGATDTLTLDRTQYASAAVSAKDGVSRELLNPALDNADMDGTNWADASVAAVYGPGGRGTPKAQNSNYTP
jgi:hypothetical protein